MQRQASRHEIVAINNISKRTLSDDKIDDIVVAQSNDDEAWEAPVHVSKVKTASVMLSSELTACAALLVG